VPGSIQRPPGSFGRKAYCSWLQSTVGDRMPRVAERPVKSELRLGVMGAGRWGRHWVRVCHGLSGARLAAVCDRDPLRTSGLSSGYPAAAWYAMAEDMLKHAELDAVVIATPTSSHAALANLALDHG